MTNAEAVERARKLVPAFMQDFLDACLPSPWGGGGCGFYLFEAARAVGRSERRRNRSRFSTRPRVRR
jgi:hypothetical protein